MNLTPASEMTSRRLGYWMSEKKIRKLNIGHFVSLCKQANIEVVKIDLERSLDEQGPFDVVLHKLSDYLAKAVLGDRQAQHLCSDIESYFLRHPNTIVLDPLSNVRLLLDRYTQYSLVENGPVGGLGDVFIPSFVELTTTNVDDNIDLLHGAGVKYPFVCKPLVAHGSSIAHEMSIIFNKDAVGDVRPPCVAQTFVNHNALLYKVFVIGDEYHMVERPSIKNLYPGDNKTIFFSSQDVSKADSASFLNKRDEIDELSAHTVNPAKIGKLVSVVKQRLGLALFGIDVIIERETGRYAIIDINTFPGYDGVPNFFELLIEYILKLLVARDSTVSEGRQLTCREAMTIHTEKPVSDLLTSYADKTFWLNIPQVIPTVNNVISTVNGVIPINGVIQGNNAMIRTINGSMPVVKSSGEVNKSLHDFLNRSERSETTTSTNKTSSNGSQDDIPAFKQPIIC